MTSTPAHPPPINATTTHQNETIGTPPHGCQKKRASGYAAQTIAAESESTFSLFAISRIVADLQSSSGVDFPGM
jgi:hypothetical protein